MKPILYESTEKDFTTNGLGRLSDAIKCTVTEERNGAYELEMIYPISGIHYADITYDRLIYAKPSDGADEQPFQIYYISRPMSGQITVKAEHISYRMSDIPIMPFSATDVLSALDGLNKNAAEESEFTFWTDKDTIANFAVTEPVSMRSRLGGVEGSIIDAYGGEWEFDKFTAKLWNHRGKDNGVNIRYGKNLTDLTQEENIANTYTGVLPYWKGTEGEDDSEVLVTLDEKIIYTDNAKMFSHPKTLVLDVSTNFENKPTQDQIRSYVNSYIKSNNIGKPSVSLKLNFIPLWQTEEFKDAVGIEHVNLCDTVHVQYPKLGVSADAKVIKTTYDVLLERYNSIELGDARYSLNDTISNATSEMKGEIKKLPTKSDLQKSVDRASKLITGGLGGYVVIKQNADGQPEEILILGDTPVYTEAKKVWRWNKNGLGYSSTGYDGEYRTAITADGHIVADFIDTGTLDAAVVKAGILTDKEGFNSWNLNTGEFKLSPNSKVGTSTVASQNDVSTAASDATSAAEKYADGAAKDAVEKQTQSDIFNKLTNNGAVQGIYLHDGKLYINASYIGTGVLQDKNQNVVFDLDNGKLTMKKGEINIGNKRFYVDENGNLTANNVDLTGSIKSKYGNHTMALVNGGLYISAEDDGSSEELAHLIIDNTAKTQLGAYVPEVELVCKNGATVFRTESEFYFASSQGNQSDPAWFWIDENGMHARKFTLGGYGTAGDGCTRIVGGNSGGKDYISIDYFGKTYTVWSA